MIHTESHTILSQANLSDCGQYRYWLSRIWDNTMPVGAFICINPSKATSILCDLTLCNCNNLAVQWGWGGFYIVNLFAFRATNPNELKNQSDPVGPLNDNVITEICNKSAVIVFLRHNLISTVSTPHEITRRSISKALSSIVQASLPTRSTVTVMALSFFFAVDCGSAFMWSFCSTFIIDYTD